MQNNFPACIFDLFGEDSWCPSWESNYNADCLHHILGRVSNSPYNAAPLNNFKDHMPEGRVKLGLPGINSIEVQKKYLKKTKAYLDEKGYVPNEKDLYFLNKYKDYYN